MSRPAANASRSSRTGPPHASRTGRPRWARRTCQSNASASPPKRSSSAGWARPSRAASNSLAISSSRTLLPLPFGPTSTKWRRVASPERRSISTRSRCRRLRAAIPCSQLMRRWFSPAARPGSIEARRERRRVTAAATGGAGQLVRACRPTAPIRCSPRDRSRRSSASSARSSARSARGSHPAEPEPSPCPGWAHDSVTRTRRVEGQPPLQLRHQSRVRASSNMACGSRGGSHLGSPPIARPCRSRPPRPLGAPARGRARLRARARGDSNGLGAGPSSVVAHVRRGRHAASAARRKRGSSAHARGRAHARVESTSSPGGPPASMSVRSSRRSAVPCWRSWEGPGPSSGMSSVPLPRVGPTRSDPP